MSLLMVKAASEDTIAAPGNRENNYVVVSVTDGGRHPPTRHPPPPHKKKPRMIGPGRGRHGALLGGGPVTGLAAANFKVQPVIVGAGGALVNITGANPAGLPGFYIVTVVPIKTETWKSGTYIFAVAVERGADKGQALASVLMD